MISKENKQKAIALTQVGKNDVGSPQVQISILTARIKEVTEHLKVNKHDFMAPPQYIGADFCMNYLGTAMMTSRLSNDPPREHEYSVKRG